MKMIPTKTKVKMISKILMKTHDKAIKIANSNSFLFNNMIERKMGTVK
jgi:hypothetical protein